MRISKKYYNGKRVLSNHVIAPKMQIRKTFFGIPIGSWQNPRMKFKKWR